MLGRCLSSRRIFDPVEFSSGPADDVLGPRVRQKRGLTVAETAEPDSGPDPAFGRNTKVRRGTADGPSTSLAAVQPCPAIPSHLRNTLPPHLGLLDSSHAAPASCRADAFAGRSLPLNRLHVWAWPKHRRSRRQAILLGSAVASTPRPVLDVASAPVSLGASAFVQVAGEAVSPDSVQPYTSFDEVNNDRTLQAQAAWTDRHLVAHAVESARLPGCPSGRMLQVSVSGFVTPQVAITQDRRLAHRRAVIFDLRRLGLGVETRDVLPGHSLAHALALLQSLLDIAAFLLHLRSGALCCSVNHETVLPDSVLGTAADVVICDVTPTLDASTRPPTPPVPESSEDDTATWTQHDGEQLSAGHASLEHCTSRWNRRFGPGASVALTADSRCTVFDPLYHVEILVSSACRHAGALLQHALASHTELGSLRDGRVVAYPIPEWPQPQVVVHSLLHGSYVMLPVSVGDKVCTLSILREASIFELLLQLEGRCGIARAYRHLVSKGLLDVHVNGRRARNVFERDALLFADTAVVGAAPALRPANSPSMLFPDSPEYVSPDAFVTIHRPELPPSQVFLPPFLTPEDVKADLRAQGLLGAGGSGVSGVG